ncbi:hypothetical protein ACIRRA_13525 [Nocardia sp. NPDC101769]|uniref:hypothetical protein n=1 Tax=Nocardia sp. NPDC101769 TaxID=3364333 RepID=UPI003827BEBA
MSDADRYRLQWAVERAVHEELRAQFGKGAVVMRSIGAGLSSNMPDPVDPVQGIDVAIRTVRQAERLLDRYVRQARALGRSWKQIGEALDLDMIDGDPAERAFEYVTAEPDRFDSRRMTWRCGSCDRLISDYGPYTGPSDSEEGHTDSCIRHRAEIAAQERLWAEIDEHDGEAVENEWRCQE